MLRYVDEALLSPLWKWVARTGAPIAAILIPAAFFLSVASPAAKEPNGLINLAYVGAVFLAAAVLTLGVGLIRGGGGLVMNKAPRSAIRCVRGQRGNMPCKTDVRQSESIRARREGSSLALDKTCDAHDEATWTLNFAERSRIDASSASPLRFGE
jgi:hypothetical protein